MLSLHAEAEARQVAQLAWQDGLPQCAHRQRRHPAPEAHPPGLRRGIHAPRRHARRGATRSPPISRRSCAASSRRPRRHRPAADMAFLALDLTRARLARAYLGTLPLYATSQVYPGNRRPARRLRPRRRAFPRHAVAAAARSPGGDGLPAAGLPRLRRARAASTRSASTRSASRRCCSPASRTPRSTASPGGSRSVATALFVRALTAAQFSDGKLIGARAPMNRRGDAAESLAAAFLERQGLKILERNYRCRFGEIDLVAPQRRAAGVRRGARPQVGGVRRRRRQHHRRQAPAHCRRGPTLPRQRAGSSAPAASTWCSCTGASGGSSGSTDAFGE